MNLNFLHPHVGTVDCKDGHVLLVGLHRPEEAHQEVVAAIKNEAAELPLTVTAFCKALEARGYVTHEYNGHTAYTDPPLAEGEVWPRDPEGVHVHVVPDDPEIGQGVPPPMNVTPAEETKLDRAALEAMGETEVRAMAQAMGREADTVEDMITAILAEDAAKETDGAEASPPASEEASAE